MAQSERLRARDWRAIFRLVGECRELGDDRGAWRTHLLAEASRLTGSDLGMTAEMAGCRALRPVDLGMVTWGWQTGFVGPEVFDLHVQAFRHDPNYLPMMIEGMRRRADRPAVTFRRSDVVADRGWYRSTDYQFVFRGYGVDHVIYGLRAIPSADGDEDVGISLARAQGRPDFDGREKAIVAELIASLTPLAGGPLARFVEPSPLDLAPRPRAVLACLLEGDGDKQIAARLCLSIHTA